MYFIVMMKIIMWPTLSAPTSVLGCHINSESHSEKMNVSNQMASFIIFKTNTMNCSFSARLRLCGLSISVSDQRKLYFFISLHPFNTPATLYVVGNVHDERTNRNAPKLLGIKNALHSFRSMLCSCICKVTILKMLFVNNDSYLKEVWMIRSNGLKPQRRFLYSLKV